MLRGVSVASELAFGHLRYRLTDVPPQSNSPPVSSALVMKALWAGCSGQSSAERRAIILGSHGAARKRVIVTPAVYPRLDEFLHFDIQSTGQKSHRVNTDLGHHNAMI
ncbi:uncharacterized protein LOC122364810 [Amphibalanus amphitrite]|uniref:uncharacterized protein LOC122364810 n=1 Tax=Amphibalanus amphitrite TaxID=1232801 RepID=UPI001C91DE3D|nr:uncharacterized protein LOC122364810 [Amphibalanus amphitrite]